MPLSTRPAGWNLHRTTRPDAEPSVDDGDVAGVVRPADPQHPGRNYPLADGKLKADWLQLFRDFPDRFIIGSDQHYPEPPGAQRWQEAVLLLNQLPAQLRRSIGSENVRNLYGYRP